MSEHALPAIRHPVTAALIAEKQASGHSIFGPSGAEMWMTCAGSLIPNIFARDDSSYEAAEGTIAHLIGEQWVKTGHRPDDLIDTVLEHDGHEVEITEEMIAYVQDYHDLCSIVASRAEQVFVEQRGDYSRLTPIDGQGGTADFLALRWQHLDVVDLKYGKETVSPIGNKQLRIYALCMFYEWDWLYDFQTIAMHICQPRVVGATSCWTISRDELLAFADEVKAAAARAWVPGAPRTPSTKGCRWCKIRATCSALYTFLAEELDVFDNYEGTEITDKNVEIDDARLVAANDFILDDIEPSPFPRQPDPRELSTAALAKLLRYRKLMENFFNSIERELLDRAISSEQDIPWWKLVTGRTLRRYVDDVEHIVSELRGAGLADDDIFKTVMLSPSQMETMLHKRVRMPTKDAKALLDQLTVKPAGKKTLAPADDRRLELPKDGDVFDTWSD